MAVTGINVSQLHERIDIMTKGMQPWMARQFKEMPPSQAEVIVDYIEAMQNEFNPTGSTAYNLISNLMRFSKANGHKPFKNVTGKEIQIYLNKLRKSEEEDPLHQWIGTYNVYVANLMKFYRWLYHPGRKPRRRPLPTQFLNIAKLKRKEESIYNPSDLWLPIEDMVFIKYVPRTDIKCYHLQARDTSARPGELLRPTVGDVTRAFRTSPSGHRYALITVQKKTTQRPLPLTDSVGVTLEWLAEHPFRNVPDAPFFVTTQGKNKGLPMAEINLYMIYKWLKTEYFPRLVKDPNVPAEDKEVIKGMLMKPWNPYIRRHTGLTEKFPILGPMFNQYSGHKLGSKMPARYVHFFGAEASNILLESKGILQKKDAGPNPLQPRTCQMCQHPNSQDAKFCANEKCRMPLTPEAVLQMMQEKDLQDQKLKDLVRQQVEEIMASKHGKAGH